MCVVGWDQDVCRFRHSGFRIGDGAAYLGPLDHFYVIHAVANGEHMRTVDIQHLRHTAQGIALMDAGGNDLQKKPL